MAGTGRKVILITGSRKGIGRYLAEHYLDRGSLVIGCGREDTDLSRDGYRHFCLDVADEKPVMDMFATVRKEYGRLDVLINNAGIASKTQAMLTPYATMENVFRTNTLGTMLMCREAAKTMSRKKGGRIINVTSVVAPLCREGASVYAASKSAVETFTRIFAKELAPFNITCNAVGPTPVDTDMLGQLTKDSIDKLLDLQAIKRMASLQDVANVVDFFSADESGFITGQVLYLGGVTG